ncbi:MAG: hypothetical protein IIY79_00350, partial [Ruminococcus sp.]|nr:hypothetical protein [Ruminococcus sp.]
VRYLCEKGFSIDKQDCCVAGGKCYTVMSVTYTGNGGEPDELLCYTGKLRPAENEIHLHFLRGHLDRLRKMALGDARYGVLADRLEAFCDGDT